MSEIDRRAGQDDINRRILDAARQLFMRFGYEKTTLNDIAEQARVSKTTLYNRWKNKDVLFNRLLWQESRQYMEEWMQRIEDDPEGGTFPGIYRNALLALRNYPFLETLYSADRLAVSRLLQRLGMESLFQQRMETYRVFLRLMQQVGNVRQDIDINAIAYAITSMSYGIYKLVEFIPQDQIPPIDAVVDITAAMLEGIVTPETGSSSEAGKQVIRQLMVQMRALVSDLEDKAEKLADE